MNGIASTDHVVKEETSLPMLSKEEGSNALDDDIAKGGERPLGLIQHALIKIANVGIKGACKLFISIIKNMIKDIGIVALVFVDEKRSDGTSVESLINASDDESQQKLLADVQRRNLGFFLLI